MQAGRLKTFFRRPAFYEGLYANMCQFFEIARKPCLCFMRPSEELTFRTALVLLPKSEFNLIKTCVKGFRAFAKEKGFEDEIAWVDKNGESRGNDVTFLENSGFKGCNTWLFGENYWSAL